MNRNNSNTLASTLNRKIDVWADSTNGVDDLGQAIKAPKKVLALWAEVKPQTGSIIYGRAAVSKLSSTTHKVRLRYRKGLTTDMWLIIEGVRYNILYILDPYLSHVELELFCEVVI